MTASCCASVSSGRPGARSPAPWPPPRRAGCPWRSRGGRSTAADAATADSRSSCRCRFALRCACSSSRRGTRRVYWLKIVLVRRVGARRADVRMAAEGLGVARRVARAGRAPLGQVRELGQQHGGLQRVEPAVEPDLVMEILPGAAVQPEPPQPLRQGVVLGDHHAAVAEGARGSCSGRTTACRRCPARRPSARRRRPSAARRCDCAASSITASPCRAAIGRTPPWPPSGRTDAPPRSPGSAA